MATAYTAVATVRNRQGKMQMYNYTASDVTAEFLLLPSGESSGVLTAAGGQIVDFQVSSGAGDTSQIEVWQNGKNTGYVIYKALNLPTAVGGRQVQQNPIPINPSAMIRLIQRT